MIRETNDNTLLQEFIMLVDLIFYNQFEKLEIQNENQPNTNVFNQLGQKLTVNDKRISR